MSKWLNKRLTGGVIAASAVVLAQSSTTTSAVAAPAGSPAHSGPQGSPAYIEASYGGRYADWTFALRTGTTGSSGFGRLHIAEGGSTHNTANHELTSYARGLWTQALNEGAKGPGRGIDSELFSTLYTTPGGNHRRMCVVAASNDYIWNGTDWGEIGIITAYWVTDTSSVTTTACSEKS